MATLRLALEAVQGTEFSRIFRTYSDLNADGTPGTPTDLTGYSAALIVRERQYQYSAQILRADLNNGRVVNGGTDGTLTVTFDGDALAVPDGAYFFWFVVWPTGQDEKAQTWLHGPFKVLPGPGGL